MPAVASVKWVPVGTGLELGGNRVGTRWDLGPCKLVAPRSRVIDQEVDRGGVAQPAEGAHLSDGDLAASDPVGGVAQPAEVPFSVWRPGLSGCL